MRNAAGGEASLESIYREGLEGPSASEAAVTVDGQEAPRTDVADDRRGPIRSLARAAEAEFRPFALPSHRGILGKRALQNECKP